MKNKSLDKVSSEFATTRINDQAMSHAQGTVNAEFSSTLSELNATFSTEQKQFFIALALMGVETISFYYRAGTCDALTLFAKQKNAKRVPQMSYLLV